MPKHNDGLERYDSNLFSRPEKELKTLDLKLAIVEKEKLLKSIQCDAKDRRVEILTGRNRIDTWAHNLLADEVQGIDNHLTINRPLNLEYYLNQFHKVFKYLLSLVLGLQLANQVDLLHQDEPVEVDEVIKDSSW
ncbi:hypothetical protein BY996DRAFT_6493208 [Phakopsora pachyrhizi]|nr:hypothetical protein BY996DRAFT_6493208 [Phakopsora pachyrhizi]